MTDKQFKECTDNYIHMLVHDASFNERRQREQLAMITGLEGKGLDDLFYAIGEAIYKPVSASYKQSIF